MSGCQLRPGCSGYQADCGRAVGGLVNLRFRHRLKLALGQHHGQGRVVQGRIVGRSVTGPHPAGILPEAQVASVVVGALDLPMPALQLQQAPRRGPCRGQRADPLAATALDGPAQPLALLVRDAVGLLHARERKQFPMRTEDRGRTPLETARCVRCLLGITSIRDRRVVLSRTLPSGIGCEDGIVRQGTAVL